MILENCKRKKTSLNVTWIDYKKKFDFLPHEITIEITIETQKVYEKINGKIEDTVAGQ